MTICSPTTYRLFVALWVERCAKKNRRARMRGVLLDQRLPR